VRNPTQSRSADYHTVVGIDPGLDGGLAIVQFGGPLCRGQPPADRVTVVAMPTRKYGRGRKASTRRDVWSEGIQEVLADYSLDTYELVVIEAVHAMPKQGLASTFNFGRGVGILLGTLATLLPCPIIEVEPSVWKKSILGGKRGVGKLQQKQAAIRYVQANYPDLNLLKSARSRKPHDGMADAVCLMDYAYRLHALTKLGGSVVDAPP
jgi:hypothetical protein